MRTFLAWIEEHNKRVVEQIVCDILSSNDAESLSYVLRLFVMEARKVDVEKYPPATIYSLLSGLSRELLKNKTCFAILDRGDVCFRVLHLTLDSVSSELHSVGIGVSRKSAPVISLKSEDLSWEKGALGTSSPTLLQHTIFFYLDMQFVLPGVQEHHDLMVIQLMREPPDCSVCSAEVYYEYTEYISKNNLHRFKDSKMKNKDMRAYARPGSERCLVQLLDKYLHLEHALNNYL